jgi:hypothetical protein
VVVAEAKKYIYNFSFANYSGDSKTKETITMTYFVTDLVNHTFYSSSRCSYCQSYVLWETKAQEKPKTPDI